MTSFRDLLDDLCQWTSRNEFTIAVVVAVGDSLDDLRTVVDEHDGVYLDVCEEFVAEDGVHCVDVVITTDLDMMSGPAPAT